MAFRPLFTRDRIYAVLALLVLLALTFVLAYQVLASRPVGPRTVVFLVLLLPTAGLTLLLAYRLWQLLSLDYWLDRDALRIHWAGDIITLPLSQITRAGPVPGPNGALPNWRQWPLVWMQPKQFQGEAVPSLHSGQALSEAKEHPSVYATQPPAACLSIEVGESSYLISPRDPTGFLAALRTRQDFGALRVLPAQIETAALHEHWLRRDRLAQFLLAASFLTGLLLLSYFLWNFPTLPAEVPLHFDASGLVDRIGPRRALMLLPSIALLILFFNTVIGFVFYERRRLAAYLLWGNALAVQVAGLLIGRNLLQLVT